MYEHKTSRNSTPKHPFCWPELESGKNELQSGQFGPQLRGQLGKMFEKWTKLFYKWAKKIIYTMQDAHSFRILFWNSSSQPRLFLPSSCWRLVLYVCPRIWHIEKFRASLLNPRSSEKGDFLSISQALFLLLCDFHCQFHMNLNIQNSSSVLINLPFAVSASTHFHVKWLTNPRLTSILPTAIISLFALPGWFKLWISFQSLHLDFLCANLTTLIISYRWLSNLRFAHGMIHPGNCCPAPGPFP